MYIIVDSAGRVCVTYASHAPGGTMEVAEPEGWEPERQHDWRLEGGELVYDPLPVPEPAPTPIEALQAQMDELTLALADVIGGAL